MKPILRVATVIGVWSILCLASPLAAQHILIDHQCTDLGSIPQTWIDQVKATAKVHYCHTSHGEQIYIGLDRLSQADGRYSFYPDNGVMPQTTEHLAMMDGQNLGGSVETYVSPDLYWQGADALTLTRTNLNSQDINISIWAWCCQLDYFSQARPRPTWTPWLSWSPSIRPSPSFT